MSPDRKKLFMWISVGIVMAVIAAIWVASMKYNIGISAVELSGAKNKAQESWEDFSQDISNNFNAAAEKLENAATSTYGG